MRLLKPRLGGVSIFDAVQLKLELVDLLFQPEAHSVDALVDFLDCESCLLLLLVVARIQVLSVLKEVGLLLLEVPFGDGQRLNIVGQRSSLHALSCLPARDRICLSALIATRSLLLVRNLGLDFGPPRVFVCLHEELAAGHSGAELFVLFLDLLDHSAAKIWPLALDRFNCFHF